MYFLPGGFAGLFEIYRWLLSWDLILSLFVLCSFQHLNTFPFIADVYKEFREVCTCQWNEANSLTGLLLAMRRKSGEVYKLHRPLKEILVWETKAQKKVKRLHSKAGNSLSNDYHLVSPKWGGKQEKEWGICRPEKREGNDRPVEQVERSDIEEWRPLICRKWEESMAVQISAALDKVPTERREICMAQVFG